MNYISLKYYIPLIAIMLSAGPSSADDEMASQEPLTDRIYIDPLFEYPVAPEDLPDLQSRSEYVMTHFWDNMDFKSKSTVDQNALNDAFSTYTSTLPYTTKNAALASINNLIKNLKGNPTLLYQFTRAAEESLYGPRADFWSDEGYLPFLKAVVGEKKLPEARKARYVRQLKLLEQNSMGKKFPELRLTLRDGKHKVFKPERSYTLIEFGNPECEDCRFAKTKLSMASDLEELAKSGNLDILFIVADAIPEEQEEILSGFQNYPSFWTPAISYGADEIFDIRTTPSFYVLDKKGEIVGKNMDVNQGVDKIRELVELENKSK